MVRLGNRAEPAACTAAVVLFRVDFWPGGEPLQLHALPLGRRRPNASCVRPSDAKACVERGVELVAPLPGCTVPCTLAGEGGAASTRTGDLAGADAGLVYGRGGHSVVRSALDLQFEGKTLDEQTPSATVHRRRVVDADFHIFSRRTASWVCPHGDRRFRLIASNPLGDPTRGQPPTLDELQRSTTNDRTSPLASGHEWSSWFRINSRDGASAEDRPLCCWRRCRPHPQPGGAQGMNTGIQDMINLGWKLALVAKAGAGGPARQRTSRNAPVMRDVLFKTENLTGSSRSENPIVRALSTTWALSSEARVRAAKQHGADEPDRRRLSRRPPLRGTRPFRRHRAAGDRVPDVHVRPRADAWREGPYDVLDRSASCSCRPQRYAAALDSGLRDAPRLGRPPRLVNSSPGRRDGPGRLRRGFGHGSSRPS